MQYLLYASFITFAIILFLLGLYFLMSLAYKKLFDKMVNKDQEIILSLFEVIMNNNRSDVKKEVKKLKKFFYTERGIQAFYAAHKVYKKDVIQKEKFERLVNEVVDYKKILKSKTVKESYRISYALYLISEFSLDTVHTNELALKNLSHKSLYARNNALRVIQNQHDTDYVIEALAIINKRRTFYNNRVVIDFLDSFKGSQKDLDQAILKKIDIYNNGLTNIILDHFINKKSAAVEVRDKILDYLINAVEEEILIKSTRYFMMVKDERSYQYILENLEHDKWSVRAVSAVSIVEYPNDKVIAKLKTRLKDVNYFVRRNSAQSLYRLLGQEELFAEALSNPDPFARDILNYIIETSDLETIDGYKLDDRKLEAKLNQIKNYMKVVDEK